MIRLFEFRDLDRIMEIWLEGNLKAHAFIKEEYWRQNYETVRSVLPNAEVYVFEEDGEVQGFIGMDAEYIAGLFVAEGHRGQGIGHQLISEVKRKKRLSLHVYEKSRQRAHIAGALDVVLPAYRVDADARLAEVADRKSVV